MTTEQVSKKSRKIKAEREPKASPMIDDLRLADKDARNEGLREQPVLLKNETSEERGKRLAARKALTLKVFQAAYESHQRRKSST